MVSILRRCDRKLVYTEPKEKTHQPQDDGPESPKHWIADHNCNGRNPSLHPNLYTSTITTACTLLHKQQNKVIQFPQV